MTIMAKLLPWRVLALLSCLVVLVSAPQTALAQRKGKPSAAPVVADPLPAITWTETSFDFGQIKQGDTTAHSFEFKNTGQAPLLLTHVQTTCGCTATDWPRTPVLPGATGQVRVTFNSAGKMGRQNKIVTVMHNTPRTEDQLTLSGTVLPDDKR
jgi:hypothetical protein